MRPVYLTFDDGPDEQYTPRILDVLERADVCATFFMIGERALQMPSLVRRICAAGHTLGNHSFSHRHPWWMSERAARAEVRDGARALNEVAGRPSVLFRPPHGRQRPCMSDEAARCGQRVVLWNLSAVDWGPFGRASRIEQRLGAVRAHDVLLMHDGRNQHNRPDQLLSVLPAFLHELQGRALQALPL